MHDPQCNRARIMLAAERLFATRGYAATSVRQIVSEASVTPPMLYYYFGSKHALLETLVEERIAWFTNEANEVLGAGCSSAEELFARWLRLFFTKAIEEPDSIRFMTSTLFGPSSGTMVKSHLNRNPQLQQLLAARLAEMGLSVSFDRVTFAMFTMRGFLNTFILLFLEGVLTSVDDELVQALAARAAAPLFDDLPIPSQSMQCVFDAMQHSQEKQT